MRETRGDMSAAAGSRAARTGRAWPWQVWTRYAGALLGLLALAEAVLRAEGSAELAVALPLGLCATVPLAFTRGHPAVVAAALGAATASTVPLDTGPSAAGLIATLTAWTLLARRAVREFRAEAAERNASRRAFESTLLELTARGERARIARELHDVVAHHISMISVQAETARLTTPGMPAQGAERLLAIGDTARTALTEMRRLLGVLREDAGAGDGPSRRPQPGLGQLLDLIDENRATGGGHVRLIVHGPVAALDPGVELTAYRVVQEALTNARRHAVGAAVDVEVGYAPDRLRLRIRDNGPGPASGAGSGGHGLLGMRERLAAVGGELTAGPAPVGGFLVEATVPVGAAG
ncbi:sensor histidine kinase [Streptomyces sp. SBT349]|uniref:sensor histidine kinase n=1 Tax=Streptomyces sp. SBT349 TaxID=1580539 RepID=UPI000AC7E6BD|nr:histidine kinase [Streptomyces sp. SBT349]